MDYFSIISLGGGAVLGIYGGSFLYYAINGKDKDGKTISLKKRWAFGILGGLFVFIIICSVFYTLYVLSVDRISDNNSSTPTVTITATATITKTATITMTPTLTDEENVANQVSKYISYLSSYDKVYLAWDLLHPEYKQYWAKFYGGDGKEGFINAWKLITVEIDAMNIPPVKEPFAEVILDLDYSPNNSQDGTYKICLEYNDYKEGWEIYRHMENELQECSFNYPPN